MNGIKVFALLAVLGLATAQFSFNPLAATDFAALALAPLLINQALTPVGPPPPFPGQFGGGFPGYFPGAFRRPFLPPPTIIQQFRHHRPQPRPIFVKGGPVVYGQGIGGSY